LATCCKYLKRMAPLKLILEMVVPASVDHQVEVENVICESWAVGATSKHLHTKAPIREPDRKRIPCSSEEAVWRAWEKLAPISERFLIHAVCGNESDPVTPGVVLHPAVLKDFQSHAAKILGYEHPHNFAIHGEANCRKEDLDLAVACGVVKMNVETDVQWAYWHGLHTFYDHEEGFLQSQLGNSKGPDAPNKSYYDPRKWLREAELSMVKRVEQGCKDLKNVN